MEETAGDAPAEIRVFLGVEDERVPAMSTAADGDSGSPRLSAHAYKKASA
jgi:hypothetical protein